MTSSTSASVTAVPVQITDLVSGASAIQAWFALLTAKAQSANLTEVAVEDVARLAADVGFPGAAIAALIVPFLWAGISLAASEGTGVPSASPIGGNPDFSKGR
jgi:hypothetical protein